MSNTSIEDLAALHRRLMASLHQHAGEDMSSLDNAIVKITRENRRALRERFLSRLEALRAQRAQIVADYDARVTALETELMHLTESIEDRSPHEPEAEPDQPPIPEAPAEEPPPPGRARPSREGPRKRRGGGK